MKINYESGLAVASQKRKCLFKTTAASSNELNTLKRIAYHSSNSFLILATILNCKSFADKQQPKIIKLDMIDRGGQEMIQLKTYEYKHW